MAIKTKLENILLFDNFIFEKMEDGKGKEMTERETGLFVGWI